MSMKIRKWRDRARKVVHAFDETQDCRHENVKTLCGLEVTVEYHGTYANKQLPLTSVPKVPKVTPDLPARKVPITCLVCLGASL